MLDFKERIFTICDETDLDDKDDVIDTIALLAKEILDMNEVLKVYEKKLKETLSAADYEKYISGIAREKFLRDVNEMEDGPFKRFILENVDEMTTFTIIKGE